MSFLQGTGCCNHRLKQVIHSENLAYNHEKMDSGDRFSVLNTCMCWYFCRFWFLSLPSPVQKWRAASCGTSPPNANPQWAMKYSTSIGFQLRGHFKVGWTPTRESQIEAGSRLSGMFSACTDDASRCLVYLYVTYSIYQHWDPLEIHTVWPLIHLDARLNHSGSQMTRITDGARRNERLLLKEGEMRQDREIYRHVLPQFVTLHHLKHTAAVLTCS